MSELKSGADRIQEKVATLGTSALDEQSITTHIHPMFSRVLQRSGIYLANHSLGRPLDQMAADVQEALDCWYQNINGAWGTWLTEIQTFRERIAQLIQAPRPDCIVPKTSAGQGLRTILNCYDRQIQIVTTRAEFSSIDHILKVYANRDRVQLVHISPNSEGHYHRKDILAAVTPTTDLVIVSLVLFNTGQYFTDLAPIISEAQAQGAKVLLDLYHAVGALPVDIQALNADFAIGGCYKYLRGGPGACWLYIHPQHLTGSFCTLDTGWFAQPKPFDFSRPESPMLAEGGNAFLESTPPILPYYQARAGLTFTSAVGVDRLRTYSLTQQAKLINLLDQHQIPVLGKSHQRGAFLVIPHTAAESIATKLRENGVIVDARDGFIRICPDILTTDDELVEAISKLAELI